MKLVEVLKFELGLQVRRLWTWIYVVAALLMSLIITHARVDEAQSSGIHVNAPYVIMMLTWGGLRGAISVALALSLPFGAARDTIITVTYAIVVFSILVQGLTLPRLLRHPPQTR